LKSYTTTRFTFLPERRVVWKEVCRYLNRNFIPDRARILELGSGYGDFIGNIEAKERFAIERDVRFKQYVSQYNDVTFHFADVLSIPDIVSRDSIDVVFCSNFFEHFEISDIQEQLRLIRTVLKHDGKLIVLQPNYQLCARRYFDDWTHKSIFTHDSFADFLETQGFDIERCFKRFLPFSMKSHLPINKLLVRFYLNSWVKPFAAQFLIVATLVNTENDL